MIALLTAVAAVGGCTGTKTDGAATAASANTAGTTSSAPSDNGPSISQFVANPCGILDADQVVTLGSVRAATPGTGTLGPNCTWKGQDAIKNSTYVVAVTEGQDFEDMVSRVKANPVFTDKELDGMRVITTDRADGELACLTSIQVSKSDSITVQLNTAADERATKKACPETERVAQLIVENLRG
ncbi:DUF3558 domain-containing protein [Lentzea fradiae]|uniref:DUF3558 domain-containing protein n=1 Tax=Lentzea fradiae TaxID=200378 RepID=UPI0015A12ED2|nr:DUF3558 domain-containing protein [Lentzea fradiae]